MALQFQRKERLTAAKMNELAAMAERGQVAGSVIKSKSGALVGIGDGRNYVGQLRPFAVERISAKKFVVRGGYWEMYVDEVRTAYKLAVDGATTSGNPFAVKTTEPTLAASTAYTIYLELDISGGTLTAEIDKTSEFPADSADIYRFVLCEFTSTSDGYLPSLDSYSGHIVTTLSTGMEFTSSNPADVAGAASQGTAETLSRSDHIHRAPHWNEMQSAEADTSLVPDADNEHALNLGIHDEEDSDNNRLWQGIYLRVGDNDTIELSSGINATLPPYVGGVIRIREGFTDEIVIHARSGGIDIHAQGGDVTITASGDIVLSGLPTSAPATSDAAYTQTLTQIGLSGTTKILCIT